MKDFLSSVERHKTEFWSLLSPENIKRLVLVSAES